MSLKRVVITGIGVVSPLGNGMPALLQGLVICGACGERMSVRYHNYDDVRFKDFVHGLLRLPLRRRLAPRVQQQQTTTLALYQQHRAAKWTEWTSFQPLEPRKTEN